MKVATIASPGAIYEAAEAAVGYSPQPLATVGETLSLVDWVRSVTVGNEGLLGNVAFTLFGARWLSW